MNWNILQFKLFSHFNFDRQREPLIRRNIEVLQLQYFCDETICDRKRFYSLPRIEKNPCFVTLWQTQTCTSDNFLLSVWTIFNNGNWVLRTFTEHPISQDSKRAVERGCLEEISLCSQFLLISPGNLFCWTWWIILLMTETSENLTMKSSLHCEVRDSTAGKYLDIW